MKRTRVRGKAASPHDADLPLRNSGVLSDATQLILRRRGLRWTPQRQIIIDLLDGQSGEVSPEDIYQRVYAQFPSVNRSTVYRTLKVLEDLGIVRHAHDNTGAARYYLAAGTEQLRLYCRVCGQLTEVQDPAVPDAIRLVLREQIGFEADPAHFVIAGRCHRCANHQS